MRDVKFTIIRDAFFPTCTLGRLFVDGSLYGYTCEDTDRKLEEGGQKIPGQTAIPRGLYRLTATMSNRFKRLMPLIQGVPGFEGIRIHGGNFAGDLTLYKKIARDSGKPPLPVSVEYLEVVK